MKLIEIQATCKCPSSLCFNIEASITDTSPTDISYWKSQVSALGYAKEVVGSIIGGGVPVTGVLREMKQDEIKQVRAKEGSMSS